MNSANIIPPWIFKAHCPQCGAELGVKHDPERDGNELPAHEPLFCPLHGNVMSLEEARRLAFETNRDDIVDKARQFARDSLRESFKKGD